MDLLNDIVTVTSGPAEGIPSLDDTTPTGLLTSDPNRTITNHVAVQATEPSHTAENTSVRTTGL